MKNISLVYSTHRPETLPRAAARMAGHRTVILEEPPHPQFEEMLKGRIAIETLMLELDLEYPKFTLGQYQLLRTLAAQGVRIVQIEPYLERLTRIQFHFADGGSPADLDPLSDDFLVYTAEREATGLLLDYYRASRQPDLDRLIDALLAFARADADRFRLRDTLRARAIAALSDISYPLSIEAGTMHLLLARQLRRLLPADCTLSVIHIDQEIMAELGESGPLLSPGDELTARLLFDMVPAREDEVRLAAQALIYARLSEKQESDANPATFPHTRDELAVNRLVRRFDVAGCRRLYHEIGPLSLAEARNHAALSATPDTPDDRHQPISLWPDRW